jgi:hypothetical protein
MTVVALGERSEQADVVDNARAALDVENVVEEHVEELTSGASGLSDGCVLHAAVAQTIASISVMTARFGRYMVNLLLNTTMRAMSVLFVMAVFPA